MLRTCLAILFTAVSCCATQRGLATSPDSSRYEIAIGVGASSNTALHQDQLDNGSFSKMLVSPTVTVHAFRRLSARMAVGVRAEVTQWRSESRVPAFENQLPAFESQFIPAGQPMSVSAEETLITRTLGRPAVSLAPCFRLSFRNGPGTVTAGTYAGIALIATPDRRTSVRSNGSMESYYEPSEGFVGGLEVGYRRAIGKRMAVDFQGALQYVRVRERCYTVSCVAFPITVGLVRTIW